MINRVPPRAGSASFTRPFNAITENKACFQNAQSGYLSGGPRMGQSSFAHLTIPERELDDNQDITVMESELDSMVGRERPDLSKLTGHTSLRPHQGQITFKIVFCAQTQFKASSHQTLSPQGHRYSRISHWSLQGRPCKRKWPRPGVVLSVNEGSVQATASAMDSPVRSTTLSHILSAYQVSRFQ